MLSDFGHDSLCFQQILHFLDTTSNLASEWCEKLKFQHFEGELTEVQGCGDEQLELICELRNLLDYELVEQHEWIQYQEKVAW